FDPPRPKMVPPVWEVAILSLLRNTTDHVHIPASLQQPEKLADDKGLGQLRKTGHHQDQSPAHLSFRMHRRIERHFPQKILGDSEREPPIRFRQQEAAVPNATTSFKVAFVPPGLGNARPRMEAACITDYESDR